MSPTDKNTTHLQIGAITKTHGIRGEMKVLLHNEESMALREVTHLILEARGKKAVRYEIESVRGSSKGPILALVGVDRMEDAEALRGSAVWVERTAVAPLESGEYYLVDLVGCVVNFEGKPFATVIGVRPDPSVDTMIVELVTGGKADLPIVDAWVGEVSIHTKTVELLSTDGVIEA